jgi:hypothetical protein
MRAKDRSHLHPRRRPGTGRVALARQVMPLFTRLNDSRDIVFLDQRGTGSSNRSTARTRTSRRCNRSSRTRSRASGAPLPRDARRRPAPLHHDRRHRRPGRGARRPGLRAREPLGRFLRHPAWASSTSAATPSTCASAVLDGVAPAGMKLPLSFVGRRRGPRSSE